MLGIYLEILVLLLNSASAYIVCLSHISVDIDYISVDIAYISVDIAYISVDIAYMYC